MKRSEMLAHKVDHTKRMEVTNLHLYYDNILKLFCSSLSIYFGEVLAIIGPSGCGKSSFLRCLNRMNDEIRRCTIQGRIELDGRSIYSSDIPMAQLRALVGRIAQEPTPFIKSIYENVAYGPLLHGIVERESFTKRVLDTSLRTVSWKNTIKKETNLDRIVRESLQKVGLWDEVKDRLNDSAKELSGGQQQRLCIARTLAAQPEIILMDEPCSSLDPGAMEVIEKLIEELKEQYTIVIVTHNLAQAQRISDKTAFFKDQDVTTPLVLRKDQSARVGTLVEHNTTKHIFSDKAKPETQGYVQGRYG